MCFECERHFMDFKPFFALLSENKKKQGLKYLVVYEEFFVKKMCFDKNKINTLCVN